MNTKTIQYSYGTEPAYVFGLQQKSPIAITVANDKFAYVDTEGHLNIINNSGEKLISIRTSTGRVHALSFACDDKLLVAGVAEGLIIYSIETKKLIFDVKYTKEITNVHLKDVTATCAFDTTLLTGGQDQDLRVWYLGVPDTKTHDSAIQQGSFSL